MTKKISTPAKATLTNATDSTGALVRLWVSNAGHVTCDAHAGLYLTDAIVASPRKKKHATPLNAWEAQTLKDFDLNSNEDADEIEDMGCETCGARLIKGAVKPAPRPVIGRVIARKPAPKAAPVKAAPVAKKTESAPKPVMVWTSNKGKTVCADHLGTPLAAAIAESPRKRKHEVSTGLWAKVAMDQDNVCARCLALAKKAVAKSAPAAKKTLKAPAPKPTEIFHTVRFGDGYYVEKYTAAGMDFTASFHDAKRYATYDAAEKAINKMRSEFDVEDLSPLISVVRVTIDHEVPEKTNTRRMGVLAF